jgi:hypothetical protein
LEKEVQQGIVAAVYGDLEILSAVRISPLNLIGHVNGMNYKRNVGQVFNDNPKGSRQRERQKQMVELCKDRY